MYVKVLQVWIKFQTSIVSHSRYIMDRKPTIRGIGMEISYIHDHKSL